MAVIDTIELNETTLRSQDPAMVKKDFALGMWVWYAANKRMRIWKVRVLVASWTFRVEDLRPIFEKLLGPPPIPV